MHPTESQTHPTPSLAARALDFAPLRLSLFLWLVVYAAWPVLSLPRHGGHTLDWQFFEFFDEVARKTILRYHQFPIWNPYFCGGTTMIGNPQTTFLVPTFPLVLAFGATWGQRLSNLVVIVIGCEGAYRLARHLGMGGAARLLVAFAFPLYGRTWGWFTDGQYGLCGMTLAPWVFYGFLRGLDRPLYLALGSAFFAWILAFRGIQPGPQLAMALGIWSLLEARRRWIATRSLRATLWPPVAACAVGALAAAYIGVRIVPVLIEVVRHPRLVDDTASRMLSWVFHEIYAVWPGTPGYGAPGYAYIGIATYALFVAAVVFARIRRRAAIPLLIALWFMLLTLGDQGEISPYHVLHQLPLFRSLRNPTLYSFTGALFIVLAAGYALDEMENWLGSRPFRPLRAIGAIAPLLVALATGAQLAHLGHWQLGYDIFSWKPAPIVEHEFRQTRGNQFDQALFQYLDRGSISCYDETPWPTSPELRADLADEEYLADPSAGEVKRVAWTPNRIDLAVKLARPSTVIVNQNWASGWRASTGKARDWRGLVAVDLPAGETRLTLRMWPTAATAGILLMLLALAVTVWLFRRDRRLRGSSAAG